MSGVEVLVALGIAVGVVGFARPLADARQEADASQRVVVSIVQVHEHAAAIAENSRPDV